MSTAADGAAPIAAPTMNRALPAKLDAAAIDLNTLREEGRRELVNVLESARGRKALVLDMSLGGVLVHIVPEFTKLLKQSGVVHLNKGLGSDLVFTTPQGRPDDPDSILYMVRPSISNMKLVAKQFKQRNATRRLDAADFKYKLFFVPHKTFICEQVLRDEGVLKWVDVGECPLDLVPFDTDLLSLELESSFRELYIEEDTTALTSVAKSLIKLQGLYGTIPHIKAKGHAACTVLQRFLSFKRQTFDPAETPMAPEIDTLVLLDRAVDLVTPLLTPLTYEGIIDEFLGINNSCVKVDASIVADDVGHGKPPELARTRSSSTASLSDRDANLVPIALNSNDQLYAELRDLHVEILPAFLNEKAMEMKQAFARVKDNTKEASLNEIHDMVRSIPALKLKYMGLTLHINLAEKLKPTHDNVRFRRRWQLERSMIEGESRYDELEEMIAGYEPISQVLRLLCLQSLTTGGLRVNKYDLLRREIIQSYGYEYIFALNNMEQVGLIRKGDLSVFGSSAGGWSTLRRSLKLVSENINTQTPNDIAYISSGYAPLSVRLVQTSVNPGWAGCSDVMRVLPGPTIDFTQRHKPQPDIDKLLSRQGSQAHTGVITLGGSSDVPESKTLESGKKVMLVYLVGGVSFMEIAAMRFLSRQKDFPYHIIICTTKIINGSSLVMSTRQIPYVKRSRRSGVEEVTPRSGGPRTR